MAKLPIVIAPDHRLKDKAQPIARVDDEIRTLMNDMAETMYNAPGIGLAATQVGIMKRILVIDVANPKENEAPQLIKLANPEIVALSDEKDVYQEGCLSIPGFYEDVNRPVSCTVKGLNENNEEVTIEADGLLATCLQHEIDHLDGVLFTDHISRLKRNMIMKKLEKAKKSGGVHVHYPIDGQEDCSCCG